MRSQTVGGVRRRPRTARQRMGTRRPQDDFDADNDLINQGAWEDSDEDGLPNDLQQPWEDDEPKEKMGTKKLKKIQEKALKKEQREVIDYLN